MKDIIEALIGCALLVVLGMSIPSGVEYAVAAMHYIEVGMGTIASLYNIN